MNCSPEVGLRNSVPISGEQFSSGATPQLLPAHAWNLAHLTDDRPRQNPPHAGPILRLPPAHRPLRSPGPNGRDQHTALFGTALHTRRPNS